VNELPWLKAGKVNFMRFGIFGAGGVGGYFGGRLAQAGHDVTFIARGKHLSAILETGLRVESILGDFVIQPVKATDDPRQAGVMDVIIVAVKAWDIPSAAEAMKPMVGEETIVVPLENGVEAPDQFSSALGREHVLGGLCRISSFVGAPGIISHVGVPPYIAFSEWDNRKSQRVDDLFEVFSGLTGISAEIPVDIHKALWEKFVFIAAASGVGAVTRQPIGVYRSVPETRAMLVGVMQEVAAVGRAHGVALGDEVVDRILNNVIDRAPEGTIASMQKDIMEGRRSELDAQNGAVIRMGRELGMPTSINEFIYASLLPMELIAQAGN
jgi:2-dehydropantoate 2-reductase